MNQFEMVAIIVVAVMVASVLRAKYGRGRGTGPSTEDQAEKLRLRDEVAQLKERLHVLERIATEKENSLARQIDELRDR
jgi:Tfp pilus assembly protein PilN